MNEYKNFAALCLGTFDTTDIDDIRRNYGLSNCMKQEEMESLIRIVVESNFKLMLDNLILDMTYNEVKEKAVKELSLDSEKFEWWSNCMDNGMIYNGKQVTSWEELEEISKRINN